MFVHTGVRLSADLLELLNIKERTFCVVMAEATWAEERGDIAIRASHSHEVELARDTAVIIQCIGDFLKHVSLTIKIQRRASVHQPLVDDDDDAPMHHVGAHPPA
jgi:hypothetical protein